MNMKGFIIRERARGEGGGVGMGRRRSERSGKRELICVANIGLD